MIRRHAVLLIVAILCVASSAWAQRAKIFKIGILTDAMVPWHSTTQGFRDGLKELGYVEGKNVLFEVRATQGDMARVPRLTAELVQQKPDLILCVSDACRTHAGPIPMVFVQVSDPVRLGLVESVASPGWERHGDCQPQGRAHHDGILIVQSGTNLNIPGRSLEVATSDRIPTMYPASFWSHVGALASYDPDQYTQGR